MVFLSWVTSNSDKFDFERYFFNRNIMWETFYSIQNFRGISLESS